MCIYACFQVRPNDNIRFKPITLQEAFSAIFRTDALVAAVTALAQGSTTVSAAEAGLATLQSHLPDMPPTSPVLVRQQATEGHPGLLVRLAGDR